MSTVFNDQDNENDKNRLKNLDSVTVNRNPSSDNEPSKKKFLFDELYKILSSDSIKRYKTIKKLPLETKFIFLPNMIKYK